MAEQYRSAVDTSVDKATVGQATVMYGLPWDLTAYGGVQWANHYHAGSLGIGVSLGNFGAVSLDGVQARGQKRDREFLTIARYLKCSIPIGMGMGGTSRITGSRNMVTDLIGTEMTLMISGKHESVSH